MCEFTSTVAMNQETWRGRSVKEMFPRQSEVIPYESVKPGRCMTSGMPLSHDEMHPAGRCSRSLSEEQYGYIVNNSRTNCSMCGSELSTHKIQGQQYQPREIENHFCEECVPYWSILHSKVVGEDMSFLADEAGYALDRVAPLQIPFNHVTPAITYQPQITVEDMLNQARTHEGKPVKVLSLDRNSSGTWE